jgi:hypothetical protein
VRKKGQRWVEIAVKKIREGARQGVEKCGKFVS